MKPVEKPLRLLVCIRPIPNIGSDGPTRLSALEAAMQMAKAHSAEITVLAPNEPGGEDALRSCLALAADSAYLVQGPAVCELDTIAIAQLMAGAVTRLETATGPFAVILCADSDPGQDGLGPALSAWLGLPQITGVCSFELNGRSLRVRRNWDDEFTWLRVETPCVLSFLRPSSPVPYPALPRLMAANRAEIPTILTQRESYLYQTASSHIQPKDRLMLDGSDPHIAEILIKLLKEEHIL